MFNEGELIAALKRRDSQAFAICFERYADKLFRLAVSIVEDDDDAEAIVQESFLRLFEKLDQFEQRAKLSTWLYRVAHNASIDLLRKRRPAQPLVETDNADDAAVIMPTILTDWSQAPEQLFDSAEAQAELKRAVMQLPVRLRSTFVLREMQQLSTAETADILGIKANTVKVRLHRARLLLREQLATYFGELATVNKGTTL